MAISLNIKSKRAFVHTFFASSKHVPHVVILGGGIKGACVAAMLASSGCATVTVIEAVYPGSGISSTNHGRFHSGTWNWRKNAVSNIIRNQESWALLSQLPGVWECDPNGVYCAESPEEAAATKEFFAAVGVTLPVADSVPGIEEWIHPERYLMLRMPEASFNPAALSKRLIQYSQESGRCKVIHAAALRLEKQNNTFVVTLSDGTLVLADAVVNALGGWFNTIKSSLPIWRPELMWSYWRLLCIDTDTLGLPCLPHVITIDREGFSGETKPGPLAAVPHRGHIIFGCDMVAEGMRSQDDMPPGENWRPMDMKHRMDELLFTAHADHFPLLGRLFHEGYASSIYSFPGVYPEVRTEEAEARLRDGTPAPYLAPTWARGGVDGYHPLFGGSASTALVDGLDAAQAILRAQGIEFGDTRKWIRRIAARLPGGNNRSMIWENHRIPVHVLADAALRFDDRSNSRSQ